jgi:hypothetical protein
LEGRIEDTINDSLKQWLPYVRDWYWINWWIER